MDSIRWPVRTEDNWKGRFVQYREVKENDILTGLILYALESLTIYSTSGSPELYVQRYQYLLGLIDRTANDYLKISQTWGFYRQHLEYVFSARNVFHLDKLMKEKEFNQFIRDLSDWTLLNCGNSIVERIAQVCEYFGLRIYWKRVGLSYITYQLGMGLIEYENGTFKLYYVRMGHEVCDYSEWVDVKGAVS